MTKPQHLHWTPQHTPGELQRALTLLGEEYALVNGAGDGNGAREVRFVHDAPQGTLRVETAGDAVIVHYAEVALALRAVGGLLGGVGAEPLAASEETTFTTRGIMLDCSRNAVMTVAAVKGWLRRLALHGYNQMMLYTEETYVLPGEPYFGYQRGAYSEAELRVMDDYAAALGIEMVPCIQMLGHLNALLKWPAYSVVKDTAGVLLAGAESTYALLEKIVDYWGRIFRTRRIHIGMDEAHDLGSGRYMDLNGYHGQFEIFSAHLERCLELCRARGLRPMIWSDMYFRMGSRERLYYDEQCEIPPNVMERFPREVQLCYWDYYHDSVDFYTRWIEKHRAFGVEPLMVSGVWTWMRFWYDRRTTEANTVPCIEAARSAGLREMIFALWHDDGAYCDIDSAWVGLSFVAHRMFESKSGPTLEARFATIHGGDYATQCLPSALNDAPLDPDVGWSTALALWDDPLLGIYLQNLRARVPGGLQKLEQYFHELATSLTAQQRAEGPGNFAAAALLARIIAVKTGLAHRLMTAYAVRDSVALDQCAGEVATLMELLRQLASVWRTLWMRRHKPFGFDVLQRRLGGLQVRCEELGRRIGELSRAEIDGIPELDANLPSAPDGSLDFYMYQQVAAVSGL